jgi:hypothetical protein
MGRAKPLTIPTPTAMKKIIGSFLFDIVNDQGILFPDGDISHAAVQFSIG